MNVVWGLVLVGIGALFVYWGLTESDASVYQILAARSRLLWGDHVHRFFQVAGVLMMIVGVVTALKG